MNMLITIILIASVIFSYPSIVYSGSGMSPIMDTNCEKLIRKPFASNKEIDSILEEKCYSDENDHIKLLKNQLILKNRSYSAFALCERINNERDCNPFSGVESVQILAKKILPELGYDKNIINKALPTISSRNNTELKFGEVNCYIFDGYNSSICAKNQSEVAIDERYLRWKKKNDITDGRVKTIVYNHVEIEIKSEGKPPKRIKFLDCGSVTWGECSIRRRPPSSAIIKLNGKELKIRMIESQENFVTFQLSNRL